MIVLKTAMPLLALPLTDTLAYRRAVDQDLLRLKVFNSLSPSQGVDTRRTTPGTAISQLTSPVLVHAVRVTPRLDCQA